MTQDERRAILTNRGRRISSVQLVVASFIAALFFAMAWPAIDLLMMSDPPSTADEAE